MTKTDREGPIHRTILQWLRTFLPDAIVHHSANEGVRGGFRGARDGANRKAMGQVAGFPDLLVLPWSHIGPLLFEVKAPGNYADSNQKALHGRLEALGYRVAVVRSIDDTRAALQAWGIATKEAGCMVDIPMRGQINANERKT
jgi:hypothetical protein